MTTEATVAAGHGRGDSPEQAVARELRAELARRDISGAELARRINRAQPSVARWLRGRGLGIAELHLIGAATGIDVGRVLITGLDGLNVPAQSTRDKNAITLLSECETARIGRISAAQTRRKHYQLVYEVGAFRAALVTRCSVSLHTMDLWGNKRDTQRCVRPARRRP